MFKTVLFIDNNDTILDVSQSNFMNATSSDDVIVISNEMLHLIDITKLNPSLLILIGPEMNLDITAPIRNFENLQSGIKYLSNNHGKDTWWIVCSMETLNDLIWNGAIIDIHIIKILSSVSDKSTTQLKPLSKKYNKCDYTIMNEESCEFTLKKYNYISNENKIEYLHYSRTNEEESKLLDVMTDIIRRGNYRNNRTGVATYSTFGKTFEYRMIERIDPVSHKSLYRFPLLTTKKMFLRGAFAELQWFLRGQTDSKILEEQKVNIWKGNSTREYLDSYGLDEYAEGTCGPIYGHQWRSWNAEYDQTKNNHIGQGYDQVMQCINSLKTDPFSRRHIISGWNVAQLEEMALPPCHVIYQFYVHEENDQKYLSLSMYQRSGDTFLGVPFNICSMGLFLLMMAHQVGYKPYKLVHTIGDMHIYKNHIEAVSKQLVRTPNMFPFIGISCDVKDKIEDYEFKDIIIDGYVSHAAISANMVA